MFNFSDHLQELRSTLVGLVLILAATIIGFVWISLGIYFWLSSFLGNIWGPSSRSNLLCADYCICFC